MQDFWKNVKIVYDYLRDPQLGNVWKAMTAASAAIKFLVDTFNESFWASFDAASAPVMMWGDRKQKEIADQLETLHGKYDGYHPQSMSTTDIFNIIRLLVQAGSLIMSGWSSMATIKHAGVKTTCDLEAPCPSEETSGPSDEALGEYKADVRRHFRRQDALRSQSRPLAANDESVMQTLYVRVSNSYYGDGDLEATAIDRELIYTIIGIVLDLIASCRGTTGAEFVGMARNSGRREDILLRQGVRRGLRERYGAFGYLRYDGDRIVKLIATEGSRSTPEFVDALIKTLG